MAVASSTFAQAKNKAAPPACPRATFGVVIDVGHTLETPGATSARGVPEYEYNLRLGRTIEQALVAAGFAKTALLITEGAAQPSLLKRVAKANATDARLFLSVHHDSVPDAFLLQWEYEGVQRNFSDAFAGHSLFISGENADPAASLLFAHMLGMQLKAQGLKYTAHYTEPLMGPRRRILVDKEAGVYRYDQLIVLRHTRMPAVLLEAGSIINRSEELASASPERQAAIAAGVIRAVDSFCVAQMSGGRPRVASDVSAVTRP